MERIIDKLILKSDGVDALDSVFEKYDLCWSYNVSKEHRDKHLLGSWKTNSEKKLIKAWHKRKLVMIDKISYARFPYMCSFSHYTIKDASYGAWSYESFLEYLCKGTKDMYINLVRNSKG